jgi:NAD(P)-dependent dehydrogenase (short-subunit alcohol dehydrogenase family)
MGFTSPQDFIGPISPKVVDRADSRGAGSDRSVNVLEQLSPGTGRISTAEEVAQLIAFAAAPNNINGVDLTVDGGVTKQV